MCTDAGALLEQCRSSVMQIMQIMQIIQIIQIPDGSLTRHGSRAPPWHVGRHGSARLRRSVRSGLRRGSERPGWAWGGSRHGVYVVMMRVRRRTSSM